MICAVIGDSIGVGVALAAPACERHTIGGASAYVFDKRFGSVDADLTIISLGSNAGPADADHLRNIRARITGRVVWLLPPSRARDVVAEIARDRGDRVEDVLKSDATPRHIHPTLTGYRTLARLALTPE